MSCASRCSSRLLPLRFWASFRVPLAIWRLSSRPCWQTPFSSVRLDSGSSIFMKTAHCAPSQATTCRPRLPIREKAARSVLDRVVLLVRLLERSRRLIFADLAATPAYAERDPPAVSAVELGGVRTVIAVPMLKDNETIGIISIFRQEVRPFTDKQVALLANFAAQAVIAIGSARLLIELRQRTDDLSESLR